MSASMIAREIQRNVNVNVNDRRISYLENVEDRNQDRRYRESSVYGIS